MGLSAGEVVLQVVVFHLQGDGIGRADDALNVGIIVCSSFMREQSQRIDDARWNAFAQQVVEGEVGVFHHIVQKSRCFFLVRVSHQPNGERMENDGVAVAVCLSRMGSGGDAESSVYEVHNFRNSEMSFSNVERISSAILRLHF